mmetsp:Transcript_21971/g.53159  ORF Transcript_21971/g.53159 Transcript_21971/m.53159 type:complete len:564 (+) Transcript_21971:127-1818(+)
MIWGNSRCVDFAKRCKFASHVSAELNISARISYAQCRRYFSTACRSNRLFLSTAVAERFSVPLTLADVHLRDEQLPFAYAFRHELDSDKLISSLKEVLRRYPILGATVDFSPGNIPTLDCDINDTVPISFGNSELTLDQWLTQKRSGKMQHVGWQSGGGAPTLSPLFDDLISSKRDAAGNIDPTHITKENIATVRITYFKDAGTAIGINISHMLGDANSCFRICQVWGRAMRGLSHPLGASNNRAEATLTGMVSPDLASLLNLRVERSSRVDEYIENIPLYNKITSYMNGIINIEDAGIRMEADVDCRESSSGICHEYALLEFSQELLHAMKLYGMIHCELKKSPHSDTGTFVSTNDMITAMGWMIKRCIAEKPEWSLSMVVNLRSRGGIDAFSCLEDSSIGEGVFGNALTSVVVKFPPSADKDLTMDQICNAAIAIRQSLTNNMANVKDLQALSRSGRAGQMANQGACFSSTSWMQFRLCDIRFSEGHESGCLGGFYGRPSYPLPTGETYSSINVPSCNGGCTYKLLAPSRKVQSILSLHQSISVQFLTWAREKRKSENQCF